MEDKFVINVGRQLGSGGKAIGELLASRLSINAYDKQLINLAAEQSGLCPDIFEKADEKRSKGILSTLISYFRAPFTGDDRAVDNVLSDDGLFKIQSDVIRDLADRESCVFVGRCADYILRDHPHRINLFITADLTDRIARLCLQQDVAPAEAEAMINRTDARRASYYNYYSRGTWGEATTYDLCLNSSVLGLEGTVDFLLEFIDRKLKGNMIY